MRAHGKSDHGRRGARQGLHPPDRCGGGRGWEERRARADAISAGAERLSAHRARDGDLRRFRRRRGVRRHLLLALRRHEPERETEEFVEGIKNDVRWLGFDWEDRLRHASDYFPRIYAFAAELIRKGLAYVDHLNAEQIREYRGTLTEPGKNSPYRDRPVDENLRLLEAMKRGDFEEGECVLRAKIDMASPNINLRDPTLYRIRKVAHQRTGGEWCIYPMYDYAHTLSDALEGMTHSLCSLEFEDHRPLYDWFLDQLWTGSEPLRGRSSSRG